MIPRQVQRLVDDPLRVRRGCLFPERMLAPLSAMLLIVISVAMLAGCATKIPGGGRSYSIRGDHSKELRQMDAQYDYGPFKDQILGANSGISAILDFHTFIVRWNGDDGERKEHRVAIGPLIEELKRREGGWFITGWSTIQFYYEEPFLKIDLKVVSHSYPIQRQFFPLYQFEMR